MLKEYPVFADSGASEHFKLSVHSNFGSNLLQCQACGRTYFNSMTGDWEQGELESYLKLAKQDPNGYIECDSSSLLGECLGRSFIIGCDCHFDAQLEQIVWASSEKLVAYIKARAQAEYEEAKRRLDASADASDANEKNKPD